MKPLPQKPNSVNADRPPSPAGMEPVKRLPLTSRRAKAVKELQAEGRRPLNLLSLTSSPSREVRAVTAGKAPDRSLPPRSRLVKAVKADNAGIAPDRLFPPKFRLVSEESDVTAAGMEPDRLLPPKSRLVRAVNADNAGIAPDRLFPPKSRLVRAVRADRDGMEPDRSLPPKLRLVRAVKELIWPGIWPARFPSDRFRPVTRPPVVVTPGQASTSPLPHKRNGWSAGSAALSGLASQRLRIATNCWQSPTSAEAGSDTHVPSEQPPEPKTAVSPSLPKMATVAGETARPGAAPEMITVSAPSETASLRTVRVKIAEAAFMPAGMVI